MGLREFFIKTPGVKPGLHDYLGEGDLENYKLHLRVELDGTGILMVNASRIIHCNETAVYYIYCIFQGMTIEEIIPFVRNNFKDVKPEEIRKDYNRIKDIIINFSNTEDVCPVTYFDIEMIEPFTKKLSAPYRMDLALTYKCQNKCAHCYSSSPRTAKELKTGEWVRIIKDLWNVGIPHIVFTGGESTTRDDLPELIQAAEEIGVKLNEPGGK